MIFNMSLHASIFISILILMRKLLQNKLPTKTFLLLWLIAWIKLMIPYSLSSKWSIMNLISFYQKPIESVYLNALELIGKVETSNNTVILLEIVWCIGMMIIAIYFIYKYIKALKIYKEALPLDTQFFTQWKEKHYLNRNYIIKKSDQIPSPLTYGFISPVILIPRSIVTKNMESMECILLHEWNHIKRWDALKKLVLVMTLCVHWFNPLVWVMFMLVNRDIELCCDEDIIYMIGENKKKEYANLLINMEQKRIKLNPLYSGFGNNYMKERIVSIMKTKKASTSMILFATILVMVVTTIFATSGLEKLDSELTKLPLVTEGLNIDNDSTKEGNYKSVIRIYEKQSLIIKEVHPISKTK